MKVLVTPRKEIKIPKDGLIIENVESIIDAKILFLNTFFCFTRCPGVETKKDPKMEPNSWKLENKK